MSTQLFDEAATASPARQWVEVATIGLGEEPQQRGSKHSLVQKKWRGDKSLIWRTPPTVELRDGLPPLVWGDPMVMTIDDNKDSTAFMRRFARQTEKVWQGRKLLDCPIAIAAEFVFLRPKSHFGTGKNANIVKASAPDQHAQSPDLAKLIRAVEDSMTGKIWLDDKLVCAYLPPTERRWSPVASFVRVRVFVPVGTAIEGDAF